MIDQELDFLRRKLKSVAATLEDLTAAVAGPSELNLLLSAQTLVAKLHLAVNERALKEMTLERRRRENG